MSPSLPIHTHQETIRTGFFRQYRQSKPIDKQRRLALILSYGHDWALTVIIAGIFFLLNNVQPFMREFALDDTSIQHTYAITERVSDTHLVLIALVAPLAIMAIVNLISIRSWWDLHTSWLGVILALAITGTITNIVKVTVGRPRPDCLDRCQIRPGTVQPALGLVNATICAQTDKSILWDGFRSFPSGHSSLSFAGLGFLSFYLAGKLHLFDQRGYTGKAWLAAVPLMGASLVAISRSMDYRHHSHDILAGSLLGFLLAWFSYRQYYPHLWDPLSHRPYSPRISRIHTPLPLPHLAHDGDHLDGTGESDSVRLPLNPHHTEEGEEMELHGSQRGRASHHDEGPLPSLPEIWKQGKGVEILPPGVESSSPAPGDQQV